MEELRVEHQQPNQLEFEDADVEKVILELAKDIEDKNLVNSSVIGAENVESPEVHVFVNAIAW